MENQSCWRCKYFILLSNTYEVGGKILNGVCLKDAVLCNTGQKSCDDFILRKGLFTVKKEDI